MSYCDGCADPYHKLPVCPEKRVGMYTTFKWHWLVRYLSASSLLRDIIRGRSVQRVVAVPPSGERLELPPGTQFEVWLD